VKGGGYKLRGIQEQAQDSKEHAIKHSANQNVRQTHGIKQPSKVADLQMLVFFNDITYKRHEKNSELKATMQLINSENECKVVMRRTCMDMLSSEHFRTVGSS